MSTGPGLFSDIGKKAKDLLTRYYLTDQKVSVSTSSVSDVAITSSAKKKGGLSAGDVGALYKYNNILVDVKVDTDSKIGRRRGLGQRDFLFWKDEDLCITEKSDGEHLRTACRSRQPEKEAAVFGFREFVLRDNQLKTIPDVSINKTLMVFDVSFNEITSMSGLSKASSTLKELYVSKNEVTKIEEIDHLYELQILELGSNRLRVIENLQNLTNLQELWLGRNRIKSINLCGLRCIKKLSLQSNRLTSMKGLEECVALEELYLSHNGIAKMEGLSTLANLRVLDVSSNKLAAVEDIEKLTCLEDLWFNDNQLASLDGIAEAVSGSREKLTTIYLERNPCAKFSNYVTTLREIFPNIEQIDSEVFA